MAATTKATNEIPAIFDASEVRTVCTIFPDFGVVWRRTSQKGRNTSGKQRLRQYPVYQAVTAQSRRQSTLLGQSNNPNAAA